MIPKRGAIAGFLTVIGLALLLSFKTPDVSSLTSSQNGSNTAFGSGSQATADNGGGSGSGNANGNGGSANGAAGSGSGSGSGSGQASSFSGTVTGQAVQIPFGVVQVQVTFRNGKMTDVQAVQLPQGDRHTNEVSQYAGPQLRTQALQAQSANINGVSGATYTSYGYQQSLQSALDQAH